MHTTQLPLEIPLAKSNLRIMLVGCAVFIVLGLWFMISPPAGRYAYMTDPTRVGMIGMGAVLFFGAAAVAILRKMSDNKPGFIVDSEGIVDNSSAVSVGRINWDDIVSFSQLEIQNQQFILVTVKNPQQYIDGQSVAFKRSLMKKTWDSYGTPLTVSPIGLSMPIAELYEVLNSELARRSRA